jgi:hypothetical protein
MLRTAGGRPGWRRLLASYVLPVSSRCPASRVAGVTGKTPVQRRRGISRASAASQARSGLVPHPPGVTAQYRVLVPEDQQPGILRLVPAERHDGQG